VLDAALENRPDQSGVLLDAYIRQPGNETRIIATEAWAGAADAPPTRQTLDALAAFATVVVYYRDGRQSTITASEQGVAGEPPIEGWVVRWIDAGGELAPDSTERLWFNL
jgi:hypothetical protein